MNTYIYVITNDTLHSRSEYKVGRHTGDAKSLISRYKTYLVDPIIIALILVDNHDVVENKIKKELTPYRMSSSEWIKDLNYKELLNIIFTIIIESESKSKPDTSPKSKPEPKLKSKPEPEPKSESDEDSELSPKMTIAGYLENFIKEYQIYNGSYVDDISLYDMVEDYIVSKGGNYKRQSIKNVIRDKIPKLANPIYQDKKCVTYDLRIKKR